MTLGEFPCMFTVHSFVWNCVTEFVIVWVEIRKPEKLEAQLGF